MSGTWHISPGPGWQRFTSEQPGLQMLGIVQRGAQIGALARREDGRYVQVNGDHLTPLGAHQVERALRKAIAQAPRDPMRRLGSSSAVAPTVVIKKKRRVIAVA